MYDKIELLVPTIDQDLTMSLEAAADKLDYDSTCFSRKWVFNRYDQPNDMSLLRGSLAKFYLGENMTPLSFGDVGKALYAVGKAFALKLNDAKVRSLEFGSSFIVKHPACEYLKLFGNCRYFTRSNHYNPTGRLETVTYYNKIGKQKFIAYDKVAEMNKNGRQKDPIEKLKVCTFNKEIEMKDKRRIIPDLYKGTNVLRIEYAIKKDAIRKLFGKGLAAYDLADFTVYATLQKRLWEFYKSIPKMGRGLFINPTGTKRMRAPQFGKFALEQLRQLQPEEYNFLLQEVQAHGLLSKNTYFGILAGNGKNSKDYNISHASELTMELDALVKLKLNYLGVLMSPPAGAAGKRHPHSPPLSET